jgi:hypothetical protein
MASAVTRLDPMPTPTIHDAFDNFEFGGTVDVSISYDPGRGDIRLVADLLLAFCAIFA